MRGLQGVIALVALLASLPGWGANAWVGVPSGTLEPFLIPKKPSEKQKTIRAIEVQEYAVTHEDFLAFLRENPRWRKSQASRLEVDESYLSDFSDDLTLKKGVLPKSPVTFVSWFAARAYCKSIGARIPRTDEWEYFAAASETQKNAEKDPAFLSRILDWYSRPRQKVLPSVKSTYRNAYGLYDLHGLIWEWVEDFDGSPMSAENRNNTEADSEEFCGSGALTANNKEDYAAFMRFALRSSLKRPSALWNLGFRCVR